MSMEFTLRLFFQSQVFRGSIRNPDTRGAWEWALRSWNRWSALAQLLCSAFCVCVCGFSNVCVLDLAWEYEFKVWSCCWLFYL